LSAISTLSAPVSALSLTDFILVYLIPILFLGVLWVSLSFVIYLLVHSPLEFDFKHDLLRNFEEMKRLPSNPDRLSFGYTAMLLLGDNCVQATLLYRLSHFFARRNLNPIALFIHAFSRFATHTDISPWAEIGPGFYLYHGHGTVLGKGVRIGKRALVCQGVSVARATVGDDVRIWAGAQVVGGVMIGDRSEVSANAVVIRDVPPDVIVFGVPARPAGKTGTAREDAAPTMFR
jgi:serine O-acetyltransferase